MKTKLVKVILIGMGLALVTACNPLTSTSLGIPDWLKNGHSTWYASTVTVPGEADGHPFSTGFLPGYGLACLNAIAKAENANPGKKINVKKIKVTGTIDEKSGRINRLTCRIKI